MASKLISKLTKEQSLIHDEYRARYFRAGWSTEPSDRKTAEEAIVGLYACMKKPAPRFIWFDSPHAAVDYIYLKKNKRVSLSGTDGQLDVPWVAYYDFGRVLKHDVYKEEHNAQLDLWIKLSTSTGVCYPYSKVCLMTERPEVALHDEAERLHCDTGPALKFRDGNKLYAIHGLAIHGMADDGCKKGVVSLGEIAVERPWDMTLGMIEQNSNAELRAIMQDRWCYEDLDTSGHHKGRRGGRWLSETGAEVINMDSHEIYPGVTQMRALMKDKHGHKYLVGGDGSTDRVYYMRVDDNATTCEEGHMSINGGVPDSKIKVFS
jgi:hypothetical protein